jgi:hypothetical protein
VPIFIHTPVLEYCLFREYSKVLKKIRSWIYLAFVEYVKEMCAFAKSGMRAFAKYTG